MLDQKLTNFSGLTEEDLKNKIIIPYLKDLGLTEENLVFEHPFSIRLSRSDQTITPDYSVKGGRLDILVKNNGQNLFVIELKSPTHNIRENDVKQVIFYARHLEFIAPFCIVTNGKTTKIFDTVTRVDLTNTELRTSDYVKNKYTVSLSPELRLEAFMKFVEINKSTLSLVCKSQVTHRILNLKSTGTNDKKKKYIPELTVERTNSLTLLNKFLKDESKQCFVISGHSGTGKTNLICKIAEQLLEEGNYVFFFYAGMMTDRIESSLSDDLNWELNHNKHIIQYIFQLSKIVNEENKKLIICIDAVDEWANNNSNILLNDFINHIYKKPIKVIFTCKTSKVDDFLMIKGNPLDISKQIFTDNKSNNLKFSLLLDKFDRLELESARIKYKEFFRLTNSIEGDILIEFRNPELMRIGCETYEGKQLPSKLNSVEIISNYLKFILKKTNKDKVLRNLITRIGKIMLSNPNNTKNIVLNSQIESYDQTLINILVDYNLFTERIDKYGRAEIFFTYDKIQNFILCYYVLELDRLSHIEFELLIKEYILSKLFRDLFLWYRTMVTNQQQIKIIKKHIFEYYKNRALYFVKKYEKIAKQNLPSLLDSEFFTNKVNLGILLLYSEDTLEFHAYTFRNLKNNEEIVVFESVKSWNNVIQNYKLDVKYGINNIAFTSNKLFEDISENDFLRNILKNRMNEIIKNRLLTRDKNNYLLIEETLSLSKYLYSISIIPFNIYDILPISCNELLETFNNLTITPDSIYVIKNGKRWFNPDYWEKIQIKFFILKNNLKILIKNSNTIITPLLPLGDLEIINGNTIHRNIDHDLFYSKQQFKEYLTRFFEIFFIEYKIIIENNFPKYKNGFKIYNTLPYYFFAEIKENRNGFDKYNITYVICKNIIARNEIKIELKKDNISKINENEFIISTENGNIIFDELQSTGSMQFFIDPNGLIKCPIQSFLYDVIKGEINIEELTTDVINSNK